MCNVTIKISLNLSNTAGPVVGTNIAELEIKATQLRVLCNMPLSPFPDVKYGPDTYASKKPINVRFQTESEFTWMAKQVVPDGYDIDPVWFRDTYRWMVMPDDKRPAWSDLTDESRKGIEVVGGCMYTAGMIVEHVKGWRRARLGRVVIRARRGRRANSSKHRLRSSRAAR